MISFRAHWVVSGAMDDRPHRHPVRAIARERGSFAAFHVLHEFLYIAPDPAGIELLRPNPPIDQRHATGWGRP
jgi:hypothetical protein